MKLDRVQFGVGVGIIVIGLVATKVAARGRRPAPPRRIATLVPAAAPADTSSLAAGDYVAITLREPPGPSSAGIEITTWAQVVAIDDDGTIFARLVGEFTSAGVRPLPKSFGIRLGDQLAILGAHVLEVYRPARTGVVLCGNWLREAAKHDPVAVAVVPGDTITIWLAPALAQNRQLPGPGWDVPDPVAAEVVSVSTAGHVLRVRVTGTPTLTAVHGIVAGDEFDITRECVAGIGGPNG